MSVQKCGNHDFQKVPTFNVYLGKKQKHQECGHEVSSVHHYVINIRDLDPRPIFNIYMLQDGHYFLDVMRREERRIQELCAQAESDLQNNHGEDGKTIR